MFVEVLAVGVLGVVAVGFVAAHQVVYGSVEPVVALHLPILVLYHRRGQQPISQETDPTKHLELTNLYQLESVE